jgi:hypothetical protein
MSLDVYVGPYIKFPTQKENKDRKIKVCSNSHVFLEHCEHSFCPKCGLKIKDGVSAQVYTVYVYEIVGDDVFVEMHNDGDSFIYSNDTRIGFRSDNYEEPIPITPEVIEEEKNKFLKLHQEDIAKLEESFGFKLVIGFGYLEQYY